ncbi:hypothetical protein Emag_004697 [Eimeria magna]
MAFRAKQTHFWGLFLLSVVYPRGCLVVGSHSLPHREDKTESSSAFLHWGTRVNEGQSDLTGTFVNAESPRASVDHSSEQDVFIARENEEERGLAEQVGVTIPRPSSFRTLLTALYVSLAVLAFLGIAGFRRKWPEHIKGVSAPEDLAPSGEETCSRLAAVERLAPAAERLAEAAGTHEAETLLRSMYASLSAANKAKQDTAKTQLFLDEALSALIELHQVAAKVGATLLADGPPSIADEACLAPNLEDLLDFNDAEAVAPFYTYMRSLSDHYDRRTEQMREAVAHLQASGQLKDEDDGSLLVSAAADLEALRQAVIDRRHTADVLLAIRNKTRSFLRTLFLRESYQRFRQLDGDLDIQNAYFSILEEVTLSRTTKGSTNLLELEANSHLQEIRSRLNENSAKLSLLIEEAGTIALKFTDIVEKSRKIADGQQLLQKELMETLALMAEHFQSPTIMDSRAREVVKQVIVHSLERIKEDKKDVNDFIRSFDAKLGLDHASESSGLHQFAPLAQSNLIGDMSYAIRAIDEELKRHCQDLEHILKRVEGSPSFTLGVNMMNAAVSIATEAVAGRTEMRLFEPEVFLMTSLQEDFNRIRAKAADAASYIDRCPSSERQKLKELEEQLHAASDLAAHALTLSDRAQAVADMQALTDELWGRLQTHARKDFL